MLRRVMVLLAAVNLMCLWVVAAGDSPPEATIEFDHATDPSGMAEKVLYLADGDRIQVNITHACTDCFKYEVTGIELTGVSPDASGVCKQQIVTKKIEHRSRYAGYYVRATRKKEEGDQNTCKDLEEKTWIFRVESTRWHTDIHVGLFGSGLVEPKYYLENDDDGHNIVARDRAAEDDVSFGFTTFATVYHDDVKWIGFSLGLSISDNNLGVLTGPTIRLGGRAALTAGYQWAQVKALPSGVHIGDPYENANLATGTRMQGDWFIAISIRGFTDILNPDKKLATTTTTKKE